MTWNKYYLLVQNVFVNPDNIFSYQFLKPKESMFMFARCYFTASFKVEFYSVDTLKDRILSFPPRFYNS